MQNMIKKKKRFKPWTQHECIIWLEFKKTICKTANVLHSGLEFLDHVIRFVDIPRCPFTPK